MLKYVTDWVKQIRDNFKCLVIWINYMANEPAKDIGFFFAGVERIKTIGLCMLVWEYILIRHD